VAPWPADGEDMSQIGFHIAGALMTLLGVLCLLSAAAVIVAVDGVVGLPAGALAAAVTFQALRVPVGRTAVRVLER
jgi:hypothetical protein